MQGQAAPNIPALLRPKTTAIVGGLALGAFNWGVPTSVAAYPPARHVPRCVGRPPARRFFAVKGTPPLTSLQLGFFLAFLPLQLFARHPNRVQLASAEWLRDPRNIQQETRQHEQEAF
eukprot:gene2902-3487_t